MRVDLWRCRLALSEAYQWSQLRGILRVLKNNACQLN